MTPASSHHVSPVVRSEGSMPNCWDCCHMGITYVAQMPYLCRAMGIKTRALPGIEVLRADGHACRAFDPKKVTP